MADSHILDLPSPIDDLRLMCGKLIGNADKNDSVAMHTAMATCIPCLRAFTLKLEGKIARLEQVINSYQEKQVEAEPVKEDD
jgi:hypothetical protein